MNCGQFNDWLQSYLDSDHRVVESEIHIHLAECPHCRTQEAATRRLFEAMQLNSPPAPPARLAARITGNVLAARAARQIRQRWLIGSTMAAAVLLVGIITGYSWRGANVPSAERPLARSENQRASPFDRQPAEQFGKSRSGPLADRRQSDGKAPSPLSISNRGPSSAVAWIEPLEPSLRSLRNAGTEISSGLEPVVSSAQRAVHLFIREAPWMETVSSNQNKPTGPVVWPPL
jgi:hypothetical protein